MYYDTNNDCYLTLEELENEYKELCDVLQDDTKERFPHFNLWLSEITGKNGTIEKV